MRAWPETMPAEGGAAQRSCTPRPTCQLATTPRPILRSRRQDGRGPLRGWRCRRRRVGAQDLRDSRSACGLSTVALPDLEGGGLPDRGRTDEEPHRAGLEVHPKAPVSRGVAARTPQPARLPADDLEVDGRGRRVLQDRAAFGGALTAGRRETRVGSSIRRRWRTDILTTLRWLVRMVMVTPRTTVSLLIGLLTTVPSLLEPPANRRRLRVELGLGRSLLLGQLTHRRLGDRQLSTQGTEHARARRGLLLLSLALHALGLVKERGGLGVLRPSLRNQSVRACQRGQRCLVNLLGSGPAAPQQENDGTEQNLPHGLLLGAGQGPPPPFSIY